MKFENALALLLKIAACSAILFAVTGYAQKTSPETFSPQS